MTTHHTHLDVDILVNGKPVKTYNKNGRVFIEAKEGSEYTIKFNNKNLQRVLVVPSVDGINAIDGEAAGASDVGYVVNGYNKLEIKGFRTSNETVNAFKFSKKEQSYAAKSEVTEGDTSSCGVIGLKIYNEVQPKPSFLIRKHVFAPDPFPTPWNEDYPHITWGVSSLGSSSAGFDGGNQMRCMNMVQSDMTAMNFCATPEPAPKFDMGTEFSKNEIQDSVTEVEFKKGNHNCTIEFFYASREALIEMGVLERETQVAFPNAFPRKFCKPPKA